MHESNWLVLYCVTLDIVYPSITVFKTRDCSCKKSKALQVAGMNNATHCYHYVYSKALGSSKIMSYLFNNDMYMYMWCWLCHKDKYFYIGLSILIFYLYYYCHWRYSKGVCFPFEIALKLIIIFCKHYNFRRILEQFQY